MKRKVLTFQNEEGNYEDLIPYVDDLSIQIGGTNLRDYLAQIEDNLEISKLFLGAFTSESILLQKYPDGSGLPAGTYAIVTDEDALYIYDTDNLRWLKTASATIGIIQLNGLTAINGSLTITGGDINSTVPNATTTTQTITNHLNDLYNVQNTNENVKLATITYDYGLIKPQVDTSAITFRFRVYDLFRKSRFIYAKLRSPADISSISDNPNIKINIEYQSGETRTLNLYSADYEVVTYRDLNNYLGFPNKESYVIIDLLADESSNIAVLTNLNKSGPDNKKSVTYDVLEDGWLENEEGTGYKYIITAGKTSYASSYVVLNVYKQTNNIKTTAIVDYTIEENIITIYSDEMFAGGITIQYRLG